MVVGQHQSFRRGKGAGAAPLQTRRGEADPLQPGVIDRHAIPVPNLLLGKVVQCPHPFVGPGRRAGHQERQGPGKQDEGEREPRDG